MSRRTKLIILVVFLVLLGISAAHVALTWAPAEPLTFQIERITTEGRKSHLDNVVIHVRIRNTSAAPIYHVYATMVTTSKITRSGSDHAGTLYAEDFGSSVDVVPSKLEVLIPAHAELLVSGHLNPTRVEAAQRGELHVVHIPESTLHRRVFLASLPVRKRLPAWAHAWMPAPMPAVIVPLEAAIDGPPASFVESPPTNEPTS